MADENANVIAALKGLSPADQAAMQPETYVNPAAKGIVGGTLSGLWNIPKGLVDAAKVSAAHHYGPSPGTMSDSDVWTDPLPSHAANAAMALSGIGAPMAEVGAAGMLGGKLARGADLRKLNTAEDMAAYGQHPHDVLNETGWFRSPADNLWRFEIPDNKASLKYMPMGEGERALGLVDSLVNHGALFEHYPEIRNYNAEVTKGSNFPTGNGLFSHNPKTAAVIAPNSAVGRSVMLHELQHGVQAIEGFSNGITPSYYAGKIEEGLRKNPELMRDFDFNKLKGQAEALYHRTAGEVEARNVQKRADYSPELRKILPPWETQDVLYNDQFHFDPVTETVNALRRK